MPYLGIFWAGISKKIVIFQINSLEFVEFVAKFCEKTKILKLWVFLTKNAFLGYFWARIKKKLLSYLKSTPSNFSNSKISRKNKNP